MDINETTRFFFSLPIVYAEGRSKKDLKKIVKSKTFVECFNNCNIENGYITGRLLLDKKNALIQLLRIASQLNMDEVMKINRLTISSVVGTIKIDELYKYEDGEFVLDITRVKRLAQK